MGMHSKKTSQGEVFFAFGKRGFARAMESDVHLHQVGSVGFPSTKEHTLQAQEEHPPTTTHLLELLAAGAALEWLCVPVDGRGSQGLEAAAGGIGLEPDGAKARRLRREPGG